MKIFLGISEIAGFFSRLKIGLELLGHEVDFIDIARHPFTYGGSTPLPASLNKLFAREKKRYGFIINTENLKKSNLYFFRPRFLYYSIKNIFLLICNIIYFIFYFRRYDSVIFIFGNSLSLKTNFVYFNELFWLRFIGVKILFLMCGSDSRPAFVDGAIIQGINKITAEAIINQTLQTEQNNKQIEKYAHFIISNPFSSYFFNKPIIPIQTIGHASIIDREIFDPKVDCVSPSVVKILHAPSVKDAKGTSIIKKIIDELLNEGYLLEFKMISGMSNEEVISEIKNCDFVIDQLYSDYPMAGFASEAARYEKPAVVGTYLTYEDFKRASPVLGVPPTYLCHPDDLKKAVIQLIDDREYRQKLGEDAYQYVTQLLHPQRVAQRYVDLINNNYPKDWKVDPQAFISPLPLGMSRAAMFAIMELVSHQSKMLSTQMQKLLEKGLIEAKERNFIIPQTTLATSSPDPPHA